MPIYRDKATGQWRWEFSRRINGQRIRKRLLLPAGWTRAQADAFDTKESAALLAVARGIEKPRRTIDDAVACFVRERIPHLKAGANTERELEAMRDWWEGRPIEELPEVCAEYAADQHGALSPATIKNRCAYLRSACRWAWRRHRMVEHDPGARVVTPTVRNARDVVVSRRQMVALARACRHRGVRAVIRIAWWTGMRVGEILAGQREPGLFVLPDTKNGSPRIVPCLPIISTAARVPMPRRGEIDYYWPLARDACKLGHVRLHDLRHAHASALANAGVDLGTIGRILGHKSAASTRRYAHHSVDHLRAAMSRLAKKAG